MPAVSSVTPLDDSSGSGSVLCCWPDVSCVAQLGGTFGNGVVGDVPNARGVARWVVPMEHCKLPAASCVAEMVVASGSELFPCAVPAVSCVGPLVVFSGCEIGLSAVSGVAQSVVSSGSRLEP